MKVVSLVSLKGGTGRTALAAHLAATLSEENRRVMVVDFDPQNALGNWFSIEQGERFGIARRGITGDDIRQILRRSYAEVPFLPFGTCSEEEILEMIGDLQNNPDWLKNRLDELLHGDYDILLIDTPAGYNSFVRQVLRVSDLALVVLSAESASYATIPATEDFLDTHCRYRPEFQGGYYLLNNYDARRQLCRDVHAALNNLMGEHALPMTIPYDESLRESIAHRHTLFHKFPDSHVLTTLRELAQWLVARLDSAGPREVIRGI